ncbi:hypothetical protein OFAG_00554 [Oxalobacter formigenes HOxBLS]|uniref:N-acetyltransferase domain-containing protein n=2 Tax=Oxalobacter paraformigenes TaxID=556268 RepID=C3X2G5_9BURK|nr:hypothetical protein OFAG_00554 [Oxalobacter paraformigenes]
MRLKCMTEKNSPKTVAETGRLLLRELTADDFPGLCRALQDEVVTKVYERTFTDREIRFWLEGQFRNYRDEGFGMWAVVLKESGEMIGHAGIFVSRHGDDEIHEIGYLFEKAYWGNGYATEAVLACRKVAFDILGLEKVYSIIRADNMASRAVARKNGMRVVETVYRLTMGKAIPHYVYRIANPERKTERSPG